MILFEDIALDKIQAIDICSLRKKVVLEVIIV